MKARQIRIVLIAAAILVGSFLIMRFLIAQKKDIPNRPPAIAERWVKTELVSYSDILSPVFSTGRAASQAEVGIIAEASGKIETGDVPLKRGQSFRKGQVLLTIYKDEAELALKAEKSNFLKTIANLLPDLKIDYPEYYDAYFEFFNQISIDKDLPSMPTVSDEKLKIFLASRNVLDDYYAILQSQKALDRHTIYAPFNGAFKTVSLEVGAYTNAGGKIGSIIKTDELEIEAAVHSEFAAWVNIGDKVKLTGTTSAHEWTGTVVRIADFVEIETLSRPIFIHVPLKASEQLLVGEYFKVEFQGKPIQDCMEIPRNAVFNSNEVFIVIDHRLKKRQVDVLKVNERTVLFRGLEEGERIVVQPLISAAENSPVKLLGIDTK